MAKSREEGTCTREVQRGWEGERRYVEGLASFSLGYETGADGKGKCTFGIAYTKLPRGLLLLLEDVAGEVVVRKRRVEVWRGVRCK